MAKEGDEASRSAQACTFCGEGFPSRNKLFQHLRQCEAVDASSFVKPVKCCALLGYQASEQPQQEHGLGPGGEPEATQSVEERHQQGGRALEWGDDTALDQVLGAATLVGVVARPPCPRLCSGNQLTQ